MKHDSGAVGSQRYIFYWYRDDSAPWTFVGEEAGAKYDKINIENGNKNENKACDVKNPDYFKLMFYLDSYNIILFFYFSFSYMYTTFYKK